ncbi:MAG: hypothetical protein V4552_10040 [Pseudomonadota bacterium]
MRKTLANTRIFVSSYVIFMLLSYYSAHLGSQSPIVQGLDAAADTHLFNFPFILHLGAMLILFWICFVRGVIIGEKWLVFLPMVVFAFEFIPKLSAIPIVPSVYHLLAIVIGVACPIISVPDKSTS